MSKHTWVFTDLETVDDRPTSGVLSMGIVAVDLRQDYTFSQLINMGKEFKYDIASQLGGMGRTTSPDTMAWWKKQGAEAQRVLKPMDTDLPPELMYEHVISYLDGAPVPVNTQSFWASRGCFDYPILEDLFINSLGVAKGNLPWKFWQVRELRSMLHGMVGAERGKIDLPNGMLDGFIEHNALHDACADVLRLQYAFKLATGEA